MVLGGSKEIPNERRDAACFHSVGARLLIIARNNGPPDRQHVQKRRTECQMARGPAVGGGLRPACGTAWGRPIMIRDLEVPNYEEGACAQPKLARISALVMSGGHSGGRDNRMSRLVYALGNRCHRRRAPYGRRHQ